MKILIAGKGGREHALARALYDSPSRPTLFACPGSDGIAALATLVPGISEVPALVDWMRAESIDLCVAGEEVWLAKGLADACRAAKIPCFGPVQNSAQLESSKIFAKEFLVRHGIPTGAFTVVDSVEAGRAAVTSYPAVLKYNGLAAGKGVAVCPGPDEVDAFLKLVFTEEAFGRDQVFVEEFLVGREVSVICAVSDGDYVLFTPARDYKRLGDNDQGPNTGGMGAVASLELLDPDLLAEIERDLIRPTVDGLVRDGLDYRGFLYFGIILSPTGPKVLEFNCRFGDPEAQAVLPMVQGEFAGFLLDAAQGTLSPERISFEAGWSICLVLASRNYPRSSSSGEIIHGLSQVENGRVYHAGTRRNAAGDYEVNGGRVLAVSCTGATRTEARDSAYAELAKVQFDGAQWRRDIGTLHFENPEPTA